MRILHSRKLVFVSKPRCGSTSVRALLNKLARPEDVICDVPDHEKKIHPHMSAPSIKAYLADNSYDPEEYTYFTVTRNPIEMLWSYFKFFKPDNNGRYNFDECHEVQNLVDFQSWVRKGRVGIGRYWRPFVPEFVTDKNLSPLSLEAHICDSRGDIQVDAWFCIENQRAIEAWLGEFLECNVELNRINSSESQVRPRIDNEYIGDLQLQFPMESEIYKLQPT